MGSYEHSWGWDEAYLGMWSYVYLCGGRVREYPVIGSYIHSWRCDGEHIEIIRDVGKGSYVHRWDWDKEYLGMGFICTVYPLGGMKNILGWGHIYIHEEGMDTILVICTCVRVRWRTYRDNLWCWKGVICISVMVWLRISQERIICTFLTVGWKLSWDV